MSSSGHASAFRKERVLVPTTPACTRRYDSSDLYTRRHQSLAPKAAHRGPAAGWVKHVHPEGKPYYHHQGDNIVTESNVQSREIRESISFWRDQLRAKAKSRGIQLTTAVEMVLDLENLGECEKCRYYLIDWDERREFWVDDVDTESLGMDMAFSSEHLELALSEHFWTHVEYFPMHHALPKDADVNLVAALAHAATDQLTSELSTAPWTASECERFLNLISHFPKCDGIKTCVVARLWRTITHSQFINLYGHPGARLSRTQSILSEYHPGPSRRLARLSRVLLFNAPKTHLETLTGLWIDRVVYSEHWSVFMRGLNKDWSSVAVLGMLILLVNVCILREAKPESLHLPVTITSAIFALSSVISAVLLLRRHRGADTYNAFNAGAYLEHTHHSHLGHQPLAIIVSLPYALFQWSLLSLTVSLLAMFSTFLSASPTSMTTIGVFSGTAVLALVLYWAMVGFWKQGGVGEGWLNRVQVWALRTLA